MIMQWQQHCRIHNAFVIPPNHISLISGIFQTLAYYLGFFHLKWMVFVISALIVFSSIGEMISWIISPARGLKQAALTGTLPKFFTKNNQNGMPSNVLILQAVIVTVVCLAFTLFKSAELTWYLLLKSAFARLPDVSKNQKWY